MENLKQYALNKRYAEDTANRVEPSDEQFKTGIEYKSEARSNTLNGSFYLLTQAIQYLQFTGGLYDSKASYNEGNIVSCVIKDGSKYRLWSFRRNSNNTGTLTGNAPIIGSKETVNGIDVYVLGTISEDWEKLEDFNYSSEATPNFIISRDNEGSAKVEMPSVVDNKSIVNKEYLQAKNVSYVDNKSLSATNVQTAIDKTVDKINSIPKYSSEPTANYIIQRDSSGSAKVKMPSSIVDDTIVNKGYLKAINVSINDNKGLGTTNVQGAIEKIVDKITTNVNIPAFYTQFTKRNGTFDSNEAPNIWYKKMYGVTTTWELLFNTESVYFRTEGDLANSSRSSGIQPFGLPNLNGKIKTGAELSVFYGSSGIFYDANFGGYRVATSGNNNLGREVELNSNTQIRGANEIVVKNRLIRVYHLISINDVNVSDILGG